MSEKFFSKICPAIFDAEKSRLGLDELDDRAEFDLFTDEISDAARENISAQFSRLPEFKGKSGTNIDEALRALRDDKNLDVWPIWSKITEQMEGFTEPQLEMLAPIARILRKIYDANSWVNLDHDFAELEKRCTTLGFSIDKIRKSIFHEVVEEDETTEVNKLISRR